MKCCTKEILYPVALVVLGRVTASTLLDYCITPTVFLRFSCRSRERLLKAARREQDQARTTPSPRTVAVVEPGRMPAVASGGDGKDIST